MTAPNRPTGHLPPPPPPRSDSGDDSQQSRAAAPGSYFPLGYKEAFSQWYTSLAPAVTEHRVLSFLPHLQRAPTHMQTGATSEAAPAEEDMSVDKSRDKEAAPVRTSAASDPYGPRQMQSRMVELSGKNRFLNEFSVERLGEETKNNLVMLHGYGAGLGFFYKNFEGLSRRPNWKLYALDMLGMGRSSRPPFRILSKNKEEQTREAESWFVDALEEWRVKQGIEKFTLLGHSLGGYLAVCYALKYPGHLNKLILASPVGIPEDPYAVSADLPEPTESTLQNELKPSASSSQPATPRKPLPKWLRTLWDANISPFSIVRLSGPFGPRLVSGWTARRFAHLPADEAQALHDYSYSLFRQPGSGEYALAYILAPGAFARSPLIRRIQGVGRQYLEAHRQATPDAPRPATPDAPTSSQPARPRETGLPVVLMYGEHDWMDVEGGYASEEKLQEAQKAALVNASPAERARENGSVKVSIIRRAGHHVYLDGWEQFNDEIDQEMRDVEKRQRRLREVEEKEGAVASKR